MGFGRLFHVNKVGYECGKAYAIRDATMARLFQIFDVNKVRLDAFLTSIRLVFNVFLTLLKFVRDAFSPYSTSIRLV